MTVSPPTTRVPKRVALPSGLSVQLAVASPRPPPRERARGAALFSELTEIVRDGTLVVRAKGEALTPASLHALALPDFHALRAIATHLELLAEETVTITCRNCDAAIETAPCKAMALGPFADGELDDPELDAPFDFAVSHPIPSVRLLSGEPARDVRLVPRTVADAVPLHRTRGARARGLAITAAVVRAMGVVALGTETDAARIARALARASDDAWDAVAALFLDAAYPRRLFAVVLCPACGARNDVDAPMDRELDRGEGAPMVAPSSTPTSTESDDSNGAIFPDFDAFVASAEALKEAIFTAADADVAFVVDGSVAAVDDGGEPLLGSYVPGFEGASDTPSRAPEVTVYYRTFRALWVEEGPYDWKGELRETIEHELAHHGANLLGDDPVDDDERAEIVRELTRVHGKRAVARGAVAALAVDIAMFFRRTWPLWLLVVLATLAATFGGTPGGD